MPKLDQAVACAVAIIPVPTMPTARSSKPAAGSTLAAELPMFLLMRVGSLTLAGRRGRGCWRVLHAFCSRSRFLFMRQSSPAWPFRCNKRTFAICASTLFFTVFILRASVSREERLERYQSVATLGSMQPAPIIVAIAVSGAARGQAALRRFAASLRRHVILPFSEQQGAVSDAFLWLQDDGAEELLCSLLHQDLRICATRGGELRAEAQPIDSSRKVQLVRLLPPGSGGSADEGASIAADHPSEGYPADVWKQDQSPNTLRMLHKWRGVEALRQFTLQAGRWRSSRWSSRRSSRRGSIVTIPAAHLGPAHPARSRASHAAGLATSPIHISWSRCRVCPVDLSAAQAHERPTAAATGQRGPQRRSCCCQHAQSALKIV